MPEKSKDPSIELENLRRLVDEADEAILRQLVKRTRAATAIGKLKKSADLPIYAPERESKLLRKLDELNAKSPTPVASKSLRAIYSEIMSAALSVEDDFKVAYLGPKFTWSHLAAIKKFGSSVELQACDAIAEIFACVEADKTRYGIVPIENSVEGIVTHTLDILAESSLKIVAQICLDINHCLMTKNAPSQERQNYAEIKSKIKRVYSHPQIFGQSRNWLREHLPEAQLISASSTAAAAEIVAKDTSFKSAAIGCPLAADANDLQIIHENAQDKRDSQTRFYIIGKQISKASGRDKSSLLFAIPDKPGALLQALNPFSHNGINLSKIESRPSRRKQWEYFFFIEFPGHISDKAARKALAELSEIAIFIKELGSFPLENDVT